MSHNDAAMRLVLAAREWELDDENGDDDLEQYHLAVEYDDRNLDPARALLVAVERKRWDMVKQMVESGASLDPPEDSDRCPLGQMFVSKGVNLRLAKMMADRGADVNLRLAHILTDELQDAPLSRLVKLHLNLLRAYRWCDPKVHGSNCSLESYLQASLLELTGLNGEPKLTTDKAIVQTKQLIYEFLDHGGNVNIPSHPAERTLFHTVFASEAPVDPELISRLVSKGAHHNLTDVHGTTPLMDAVRLNDDEDTVISNYKMLLGMEKRMLLDAQNCSGESALWRALFRGRMRLASMLLDEGAASFTMARVSEDYTSTSERDEARFMMRRLADFNRPSYDRRPCISNLPALLAPVLKNANACSFGGPKEIFCHRWRNKVLAKNIAPLVDQGWFCTTEVERTVLELLRTQTAFKHLAEGAASGKKAVFRPLATIPLMFGNTSAGLTQLTARKILNEMLFKDGGRRVIRILYERKKEERLKIRKSQRYKQPLWLRSSIYDERLASFTEFNAVMAERHRRENAEPRRELDENWMLRRDPTYSGNEESSISATAATAATASANGGAFVQSTSSTSSPASSSLKELELSLNDSNSVMAITLSDHSPSEEKEETGASAEDDVPEGATAQAIDRIDRVLGETSELLARIQSEVDAVQEKEVELLSQECSTFMAKIKPFLKENKKEEEEVEDKEDELNAEEKAYADALNEELETKVIGDGWVDSSLFSESREVEEQPRETSTLETSSPIQMRRPVFHLPSSLTSFALKYNRSTSDDTEEDDKDEDVDDRIDSGEETDTELDKDVTEEAVVDSLTPEVIGKLCAQARLPQGLVPLLELEAARLQLLATVFRHKNMVCDRGCEGQEEEDDEEFTSTEEEEDDESSSTSSGSSHGGDNHRLSFTTSDEVEDDDDSWSTTSQDDDAAASPAASDFDGDGRAVPLRPRRLTSSSESSTTDGEDDAAVIPRRPSWRQRVRGRANRSGDDSSDSDDDDWFSVESAAGGVDLDALTREYVADRIRGEGQFDASTDSDSSALGEEEDQVQVGAQAEKNEEVGGELEPQKVN